MTTRNWITENLILPVSDLLLSQSVARHLHFLMKSQYWTKEQIESYQNEKLRELINHSYKNVPFYTDLFNNLGLKPEDIQNKNDLEKIPIITKDDLKRNKDKHLSLNINKKDLIFASSSGSTGEPFQFYTTKQSESFLKATAIRGWYWMGYRLGDKYVKVSMNPRSSIIKKTQDKINNCLYLSSQQLTPDVFDDIIEQIIKFNPKFIRGYPVPLEFISDRIKAIMTKYNGSKLSAINTTGSTLKEKPRKNIEEVFGKKIFDSYSCEGGAVFFECPNNEFYHPSEEYAISEFISDSYSNSNPDTPVRHITTDLHNYASPFIRYDTQDYLVLGDSKQCSCGRNFTNIKSIKGRDSDILITPTGKFLIVENFVAYFEWIPEVDQIQIEQKEIDLIIIRMIVNESFSSNILQKIQIYWNEYIGNNVSVNIEIVKEIKLTPTGKRRTVIRNPKISINV